MELQTLHLDLADKWIIISNFNKNKKNIFSDFEGTHLIGYVYIDHTAGLTIDVIHFLEKTEDSLVLRESPSDRGARLVIRIQNILDSGEIRILNSEAVKNFKLQKPDYLDLYERNDLDEFRKNSDLHEFRAEGYPDDIQVLFIPTGKMRPELMWCRAEKFENNELVCELLNTPKQKMGIGINDRITATFRTIDGERHIVCELESPKQSKKPFWNFW